MNVTTSKFLINCFMTGLASAIVIATLAASAHAAEPIVGRASVVDGDTLDIGANRIRFWGVDAFESGQLCQNASGRDYRCGQAAALELDRLISGRIVRCEPTGGKTYERVIAVCSVAGVELNRAMVQSGWALDEPRYSKGEYASDDVAAREAGRGAHAGTFERPADYRHKRRQ